MKISWNKENFKYLIGYWNKVIRPSAFTFPKMNGYIKTFKLKDGYEDKSNKLMCFQIDDDTILEKYQKNWNNIENLKSVELNALPVYDDI